MKDRDITEEYTIEKGIPTAGETRGRPKTYPFLKMEVGDSIFVRGEKEGRNAVTAAYMFERRVPATVWNAAEEEWTIVGRRQFTSRKETAADGTPGVRIWRIEDRAYRNDELGEPIHMGGNRYARFINVGPEEKND